MKEGSRFPGWQATPTRIQICLSPHILTSTCPLPLTPVSQIIVTRLEENGSLGLCLPRCLPGHQITHLALPQFPGLWVLSPLHPAGALDLALGSGRRHKQGSSGLALSGTQDAGCRYNASLQKEGETEVACRPHSALQPRPH